MAEAKVKFRVRDAAAEDSVLVNSKETFGDLKGKIAAKRGIPATRIHIRSIPNVDMTKVHDGARVMDLFPRGLTIHVDVDTAMTGQDPADAQQKQAPKDGPASTERNTAMIKGNQATEAAKQTLKHVTNSKRPVDASIIENVAKGQGVEQMNTIIDADTWLQRELAEMQLKMTQMQAGSAAGGT